MFHIARTSARTMLLAAGTAGFVALGSGFASAGSLPNATGVINSSTAGQVPGAGNVLNPAGQVPDVGTTLPATDLPGTGNVFAPGVPERTVTSEVDGLLPESDAAEVPEPASLAEIAEIEGVEGLALGSIDRLGHAAPETPVPGGAVPQVDTGSYTYAAEAATVPARAYADENVDPEEIVRTVEHTSVPVLFVVHDARTDVDALAGEVSAAAGGALSDVGPDESGVEHIALGSADDLAGGVPADLEVLETADLPDVTDLPDGDVADTEAAESLPETGETAEELPQVDEAGTEALPEAPAVDGAEDTVGEVTAGTGDLPTDAVETELDDVTDGVDTDAVDTELVDDLL
ncbi:hypothetical protein [Nocardiopsis xinjiangensis]|uniref:hypothetical protein n=1 Tax=Nocardiopsis xinjiangensis TaxID=124285 RepID=UPI00034CCD38|nr:hypothetical protein [Nocardiopsis xinjiangensis]